MKKTISVILIATIALFVSACAPQEKQLPYSAKLFDKAENLLTEEFLSENETHYPFLEDGLPDSRLQIIDNNDKFVFAFTSFPEEIDFSQDILVLYLFTDIYYGFECKLNDITENEDKTSIIIKHEMAEPSANGVEPPSTSLPIQRCLVVKLSDCSFDDIEVNLIYS